jgi:non-ribosomal peptide synthetase component F
MLNMSERLQDMVSAQAKKTPDSRAVVFGKDSLTYAQLDIQSNRLGRMLQAEGCQTGDRVALVMPKSIEAIVGMLGVLKAGCIYVPIDLDSPSARVQRIFSASDPKAVLVAETRGNIRRSFRIESRLLRTRIIRVELAQSRHFEQRYRAPAVYVRFDGNTKGSNDYSPQRGVVRQLGEQIL